MEYSKFSEMVLVNVKNDYCWRLRAVKPAWESSPLMFQLLNPFIWTKVWLVTRPTPRYANEFLCIHCSFYKQRTIITNMNGDDNDHKLAWTVLAAVIETQTSLSSRADALAHLSSKSSHSWSQSSASWALRWLTSLGRHDCHWQVKTGDSRFCSSVVCGTVHRNRGPGLRGCSWIWIWTCWFSNALETSRRVQDLSKERVFKPWFEGWADQIRKWMEEEERAF